jgi:hypothetical protein
MENLEPFVTKTVEAKWDGDSLIGVTTVKYAGEAPNVMPNTFTKVDPMQAWYWVAHAGTCFGMDRGVSEQGGTMGELKDFLRAAGLNGGMHITWKMDGDQSWDRFCKKWGKRTANNDRV